MAGAAARCRKKAAAAAFAIAMSRAITSGGGGLKAGAAFFLLTGFLIGRPVWLPIGKAVDGPLLVPLAGGGAVSSSLTAKMSWAQAPAAEGATAAAGGGRLEWRLRLHWVAGH